MSQERSEHPHDLISAFADGEVTPGERALVEEHLQVCSECRALLEDLRSLSSAVAQEEPPSVPANLAARIRWRLQGKRPGASPRTFRQIWKSPLPISAAAGLIATAAVLWVLRGEYRGGAPRESEIDAPVADVQPPRQPPPVPPAIRDLLKEKKTLQPGILSDLDPADEKTAPQDRDKALGISELDDLENRAIVMKRAQVRSRRRVAVDSRQEAREVTADEVAEGSAARFEAAAPVEEPSPSAALESDDAATETKATIQEQLEKKRDAELVEGLPIMGRSYSDLLTLALAQSPSKSLILEGAGYRITISESGWVALRIGAYACTVQTLLPQGEAVQGKMAGVPASIGSIIAAASAQGFGQVRSDVPVVSPPEPSRKITLEDAAGRALDTLEYNKASEVPAAGEIEQRVHRLIVDELRASFEKRCGTLPPLDLLEPSAP